MADDRPYDPFDQDGRMFMDSATAVADYDLPTWWVIRAKAFLGDDLYWTWWKHLYPHTDPSIPREAADRGHPDVMWTPNGMGAVVKPRTAQKCRDEHERYNGEPAWLHLKPLDRTSILD